MSLEVLMEIILVLVDRLLSLGVGVDETTVLWNSTGRELLEHSIQLMFIGSGISIEVASFLVSFVLDVMLVTILVGDILKDI